MGLFLFGISIEETFKRKKGKVELSDGEMRDGGLLTSSYKHRCGRLSPSLVQLLHTLHLFYVEREREREREIFITSLSFAGGERNLGGWVKKNALFYVQFSLGLQVYVL